MAFGSWRYYGNHQPVDSSSTFAHAYFDDIPQLSTVEQLSGYLDGKFLCGYFLPHTVCVVDPVCRWGCSIHRSRNSPSPTMQTKYSQTSQNFPPMGCRDCWGFRPYLKRVELDFQSKVKVAKEYELALWTV